MIFSAYLGRRHYLSTFGFDLVKLRLQTLGPFLDQVMELSGVMPAEMFEAAGVRGEARPEELDVFAWGRLAAAQIAFSPH